MIKINFCLAPTPSERTVEWGMAPPYRSPPKCVVTLFINDIIFFIQHPLLRHILLFYIISSDIMLLYCLAVFEMTLGSNVLGQGVTTFYKLGAAPSCAWMHVLEI
eukprot:sb/3477957/